MWTTNHPSHAWCCALHGDRLQSLQCLRSYHPCVPTGPKTFEVPRQSGEFSGLVTQKSGNCLVCRCAPRREQRRRCGTSPYQATYVGDGRLYPENSDTVHEFGTAVEQLLRILQVHPREEQRLPTRPQMLATMVDCTQAWTLFRVC
jgi:hypothetical protein